MSIALRYLLDTNILSDLIRHPQGTVASSIVIAAELRFGVIKSGSKILVQTIDLILSALDILPLETPADRHYKVSGPLYCTDPF